MKLLFLNLSLPQTVEYLGKPVVTGIFKQPVEGRVMLRAGNLKGDGQADRKNHGGACKAVYVYPFEHYAVWAHELARDGFAPGQFGENFTVEGMLESRVQIGDQFQIGDAAIEVTQPRVPCSKLAMKMGQEDFPKRFLASDRTGFYCRVLKEGEVGAGDAILRIETAPQGMSVQAINRLMFREKSDLEGAMRVLHLPALSPGWRAIFEKRLLVAGVPASSLPAPTDTGSDCGEGL
ncbi:MAG: MOSC domain-containing protein [Rhodospirillaceae bacterium]|nr:MAG: MOSC domain-containing protein [Rhodospirillaceae bacterium]